MAVDVSEQRRGGISRDARATGLSRIKDRPRFEEIDAQFQHIKAQVDADQQRAQPVISVDTKKKELIGDFKNLAREWQPRGKSVEVRTHDFIDRDLGKVNSHVVYDQTSNPAWVSIGHDQDTAGLALETIRRCCLSMGCARFPRA